MIVLMHMTDFKFTLSKQLLLEYFFSHGNCVNKEKIFSWQSPVLNCPLVNFKTTTFSFNFYINI